MRLVSIDFECANTYAYHSIFWAGVYTSEDGFCDFRESEIILNPKVKKFMAGAMEFPFTLDELRNYPTFKEGGKEILKHLTDDVLVLGHSLHNDINMLMLACQKAGFLCPSFFYIDSNVIFSEFTNANGEYSLSKLADTFTLSHDAHNPLEDAKITLSCVEKMCNAKEMTLTQLLSHYGIRLGRLKENLLIKCYSNITPPKAKHKIEKINSLYNLILSYPNPRKTTPPSLRFIDFVFAIDKELAAQYNLQELIVKLITDGASFVENTKMCTHYITNHKRSDGKHYENVSLESLIKWYFPSHQYKRYKKQIYDKSFDYERRTKKKTDVCTLGAEATIAPTSNE